MFRIHPRTLLKAALLPTALLMAAGGTQAAFASQAATTANVTSGIRSAPSPDSYYTMRLSPSSVTVRAGYRTRITVSFHATADLYGTPVALSGRIERMRHAGGRVEGPDTTAADNRRSGDRVGRVPQHVQLADVNRDPLRGERPVT
jgi:hypothetical protein